MEPLSALGVAAAAVQFLDFGSRVFLDARDIWKSSPSQAPRNTELSEIARNLSSLMNEVDRKLQAAQIKQARKEGATGAGLDEQSQVMFARLCSECNDVCKELQECLSKLKTQGKEGLKHAADSLIVAVKGVWSASKIEGLKDRIRQLRDQIMMAALVIVWGQAEQSQITSLEIAKQQVETMSRLQRIDKTTRKFGDELLDLVQGRSPQSHAQAQGIVQYVLDSDWMPSDAMRSQAHEALMATVSDSTRKRHRNRAQHIIKSLWFETIDHREEAIPKAYTDTFEWIFSKPRQSTDGKPLWSDLTQWLSNDSDEIYWITGKPGAGKSTLTKFIAKDKRLKRYLQEWTGESELILAKYFSWNAGSELQKSHHGLLRTILKRCLSRRPELLVPIVFPARWSLVQVFPEGVALPPWTEKELHAGFRALVSHAGRKISPYPEYKLVLLIDGLDEFEVGEGSHQAIVNLIRDTNQNPNVKICASSRPWNVFRDAFSQNPMLQLEKLTRPDIRLFVQNRFNKSPGFLERKAMYPAEAQKLMKGVVDKALGVFLWVSVVVWNLLQNLQEGDSLSQMQETLDSLPEDLCNLFQVMWEQTHQSYRKEASHYFDLMKCLEKHDLTPFALSIGLGDDREVPADLDINRVDNSFMSGVVMSLNRKLNSRTKGLLEIHQVGVARESVVSYMHRTAREWVQENWATMMVTSDPGFDANLWVLRGETLRLPMDNFVVPIFKETAFWLHLGKLIHVSRGVGIAPENPAKLVQVLDRLDREVTKLSRVEFRNGKSCLLQNVCSLEGPISPSTSIDTKEGIHWGNAAVAAANRPGWSKWGKLNFLGIMAQVPVHHYLRTKVSEDPAVVDYQGNAMPALVSAILGGFQGFPMACNLGGPRYNDHERQGLVKFLLDHVSMDEARRSLDLVNIIIHSVDERWAVSSTYLDDVLHMLHTHVSRAEAQPHTPGVHTSSHAQTTVTPKRRGCLNRLKEMLEQLGLI
ncbi:hypothetical protein B0J13DRAFT_539221 [Dactylonectria estremocensis]|uniref:NACHT domain-containing protein n=1 Tax=Dactylonectria estremocensis TaxID=1079267 RepID=A0A9P9JBV3_9HYPO|nr:hypothetical protein B0J13DRAFT_539221 [Dactylonectria estremocensis]